MNFCLKTGELHALIGENGDVRKVAETGVLPVINTGIAHLEAGVGQIGAGTVTAQPEVFVQALAALTMAQAAAVIV